MDEASLCRLCMKESNEFIYIFDEEAENQTIDILILFRLDVQPDVTKSCLMCSKCYLKLLDFKKFHETCLENEKLWDSFGMNSNVYVKNEGFDSNSEPVQEAEVDKEEQNSVGESLVLVEVQKPKEKCQTTTKMLRCKICKHVFTANKNLRQHIKLVHEDKPFECEICKKRFALLSNLREHMYRHLTEETKNSLRILKCGLCELKFYSKTILQKHLKRFNHKRANTVVEHSAQTTVEENEMIRKFYDLKCPKPDCGFVNQTFLEYKYHLRITHKENNPCLTCCNKKLDRLSDVRDHMYYHIDPDKLRCKYCKRVFSDCEHLKRHISQVHASDEERPFQCDPCGKRFVLLSQLRQHMYRHFSDETKRSMRIHKCSICEKSFYPKNLLKHHITKFHLKEKKFMCTSCGKSYNVKLYYELHRRNIHGDKVGPSRQQCPTCKKWFAHKKSLRNHINSQHKKSKVKIIFTCDICDKKMSNKDNLLAHMKMIHMEREFKCDVCPKAFPTAGRLKEHTAMHTGITLYKCPYCSKREFNRRVNMYKHFRVMHPKEWARDRKNTKENSDRRVFALKYIKTGNGK